MAKIKGISYIGKRNVYNMTVEDVHNYMIKGNVIVKNCDSMRYFAVWWTCKPQKEGAKKKKWRQSYIDDYRRASKEIKELMVKQLGEPIL